MSLSIAAATLDPATPFGQLVALCVAQKHWIMPLVFVIGLLKSTPVVAVFIPSTAMFVALAAAWSAGGGTFAELWLAAAAGATAGDAVFYGLGARHRHDIAQLWPISQAPALFARGETLFRRFGLLSVLGAKFVWGVRPFIPVIAGVYRMPFGLFLAVTNLSSLMWAAIGIGAGFGLWHLWK